MNYWFKNLVFEGGGAKGVAYLGAIEVLKREGILQKIERIGGTSAGAINALLLGLNYTDKDLEDIILNMNFVKMLFGVRECIYIFLNFKKRINNEFGFFKGDRFYNWIKDLIKKKTGNPNSIFQEIHDKKEKCNFKDIYFIGANLSTGFAEIYSHEDTPDMEVAKAVRISMSLPILFTVIRKDKQDDVCIDGGLINNYPIKLFDRQEYAPKYKRETEYYKEYNKKLKKIGQERKKLWMYNKETLGFKLDSKEEKALFCNYKKPESKKIKNIIQYALRLLSTIYNIQSSIHLHSDDWHRTIYIDTLDVGTLSFMINKSKKKELADSGKKCTEEYLKWLNNPKEAPANRP